MVLAIDTAATVKMTLYTNNDNEGGWALTDGPDTYNVLIQGSNSESWQVSKNVSETGTLTITAVDISGTGIHFNMWMMSNLTLYLTSIKVRLQSTAGNYMEYTLATSSIQDVTGEFHCFALDIAGGAETGTFDDTSVGTIVVTIDNSASGNIRSVINNWIDAMYWGRGLTFDGSSTASLMFAEAAAIDELTANRWGVMIIVEEQIFVQGDVVFDDNGSANTQASNGENVVFTEKTNATNTYRLILIGADNTITFTNTNISATGAARWDFDASGTIGSFDMVGGTLKKASSIALKSGQSITDTNFTVCGPLDPNGADLDGCSFISTLASGVTEGALMVNVGTEGNACEDISFSDYTGATTYAVFVAASVTSFNMTNWIFDDPNNTTSYAVYWAGTSGTLTISGLGTTNLVSAGCTAASGGTVVVSADKSYDITGLVSGSEVWAYTGTIAAPGSAVEIGGVESSGTNYDLTHTSGGVAGYIKISKATYFPILIELTYPSVDGGIPVTQKLDPNYSNP